MRKAATKNSTEALMSQRVREMGCPSKFCEPAKKSEDFFSDGGGQDSLSCVARAEPRKRLCGMTVAPKMPTAGGKCSA